MKPNVLILRAPGTNCDLETAYAFEKAGAATERIHVNRLLEDPSLFEKFQILCFPGGFSYGDDISSGRILSSQLLHNLSDQLQKFRDAGKLVLGICNGFQILIKTGLLIPVDGEPLATLAWNNCQRFQDRWVELKTHANCKNVFLKGIDRLYIPAAHAEGRFVVKDAETLKKFEENGQIALQYAPLDFSKFEEAAKYDANGILQYPDNPNGAVANIAGLGDETGRVLGLMPHPERHIDPTQHPRWTRRDVQPEEGEGLQMFRNAVEYFN
ncbi:MAG: phosphoribosylformylglycinamidine synthase subunit PurQ [Thermoguttaceae bacterium]|nr:phosphoribosylformylglycinamidine synthase subunit PurQ [Planctomycetaceae bacterium]MBP3694290.1 phosphoribosylformylglycinamidine synthase subunit PurQ [Thermoguttaceae bacterium]MBQ4144941.1 phosphoribosylformylglycinamidine synthase subunit PurQ [Thermoguttaceae bacterium]